MLLKDQKSFVLTVERHVNHIHIKDGMVIIVR
jgi:hypothetical protein